MLRRSILKKNEAFLFDRPANVAAVLLGVVPGRRDTVLRGFEWISGVKGRSIPLHLQLSVQLVRSGLRENLDPAVASLSYSEETDSG